MRRLLALTAALFFGLSAGARAFEPRAGLIAGTGIAGAVDGPASAAGFVKPYALAYAPNGRLYVADRGAERIRAVSAGTVTTFAGSGKRGYRDGAAPAAQFASPSSLVVQTGGGVLVADTGNHCIRRIDGGAVTTFAGRGGVAGTSDGPARAARFVAPVGLSTDGADGYYVADAGAGLRHVDARGNVTTVAVPGMGHDVVAVGAAKRGNVTSVFLADRRGVWVFHPETHLAGRLEQDDNSGEPVGGAAGIAVIGPHEFLYADPATHAVRYFVYRDDTNGPFNRHYAFALTGPTSDDAANEPATVVPGTGGPFVAPVAVALAPDGSVTVADAATRRIRTLAMADRRIFASGDIADLAMDERFYRIAYVSNSVAFRNVTFEDTFGGQIERILNRDRTSIGLTKPVRVEIFKLQTGLTATSSYVTGLLGEGLVDEVVWGVNEGFFAREEEQYPPKGTTEEVQRKYAGIVADLGRKLKAAGIGLFVVYHPIGGGYGGGGFDETQWAKDPWLAGLGPLDNAYVSPQISIDAMFRSAGVPYADIYPAIWTHEDGRRSASVFGTDDGHPTPYGDEVIGELIARELERARPWAHKP